MTQTAHPHGFVTKGIHWLSVLVIAYGYAKGLEDVSQLADTAFMWFEVRFALFMGALFALRLYWTQRIGGATRLPEQAPWWERTASRAVHLGLYASVFGIVLTGLAIAWNYSTATLGGWFTDAMIALHEGSLAILPLLLIAHITGALWHKFIRRDGVLESMTGRLPL